MPLFEVDASRPLLVQNGRPSGAVEPGLATTAHRVVDSHIDGLLGEQIFPVAQGAGRDEPHLLALDATGSPVVVELVAELDKAALTKALDHAGWAGRLTRGDLAGRYHGGTNAFQRDIAEFYDSVPITRSQPGRSSARLIIICQEAGEEILNAVDFLRQPTMPVEVLKMGVMHGQDGRRFVDVSPLVIHPASRPANPQVSAAPAGSPAASPAAGSARPSVPAPTSAESERSGAEPESFAEGVKVGIALTGKHPAVVSTPNDAAPRPATRATARDTAEQAPLRRTRAERRAEAGPPSLSASSVGSDGASRPAAPSPAPQSSPPVPRPADSTRHAPVPPPPAPSPSPTREGPAGGSSEQRPAPLRRSRADRFRVSDEAPPTPSPALAAFTAASASSAEDLDLAELARRTRSAASTDTPGLGEDFARVAAPALGSRRSSRRAPEPWNPPEGLHDDPLGERGRVSAAAERHWDTPVGWTSASEDLPRLEVPPLEAPSYTPPPERGLFDGPGYPVAEEDEVDGDLIALASMLPQPARLEWVRPRRGQRFEAVLHPEGFIELADGSRFQHPDRAATAACGVPTDDGWDVWRILPDGITLLEAYRSRFA